MVSPHSSEFLKAVTKNWRTPREREKLAEAMRRDNADLDARILRAQREKQDATLAISNRIGEQLEGEVHGLRRRGEITGGARRHLLSTSFSHYS